MHFLRDWLETLKSEASTLQIKSNQLERSVALLMQANSTTDIVQMRVSQLSKIKKALNMLNLEIQVLNQTCSTKGGPDCNTTCLNGMGSTECIATSLSATTITTITTCDSKCLNCSISGECLLCSGNFTGSTCSVCKIGWTGSNCSIVDVRGDLLTSSILNSTMATRFVSDIISGVKKRDIKLVFRYSRDGIPCTSTWQFASPSQVNGKGPTVLIIKATTGAIFGGYTSLNWANTGYASDSSAFLFSVQSSTGDHRFVKLLPTSTTNAISLTTPFAFGFGGGPDLSCGCINSVFGGFTNPLNYQSLGQYYLTGSGIPYVTNANGATFGSSFTPADFELYSL